MIRGELALQTLHLFATGPVCLMTSSQSACRRHPHDPRRRERSGQNRSLNSDFLPTSWPAFQSICTWRSWFVRVSDVHVGLEYRRELTSTRKCATCICLIGVKTRAVTRLRSSMDGLRDLHNLRRADARARPLTAGNGSNRSLNVPVACRWYHGRRAHRASAWPEERARRHRRPRRRYFHPRADQVRSGRVQSINLALDTCERVRQMLICLRAMLRSAGVPPAIVEEALNGLARGRFRSVGTLSVENFLAVANAHAQQDMCPDVPKVLLYVAVSSARPPQLQIVFTPRRCSLTHVAPCAASELTRQCVGGPDCHVRGAHGQFSVGGHRAQSLSLRWHWCRVERPRPFATGRERPAVNCKSIFKCGR